MGAESQRDRELRIVRGLLVVLAVLAVGWALRATAVVTMPLAFAFFLAALLHPLQQWLAHQLPGWLRWLGLVLTMASVVLVLVVLAGALWLAVELASGRLPDFVEQLQAYLETARRWAAANNLPVPNGSGQGGTEIASVAGNLFGGLWELAGGIVLVFFYTLLMLIETRRWGAKIETVAGARESATWRDIALAISIRVRRYLLVRTAIGAVTAAIIAAWLLLMGVELVYAWALLELVFNFIPTLGSVVAGAVIGVFALVQLGLARGLLVVGGLVAIEQAMGNYVDPRWQGKAVDISPLVVLVALVFWTWVWGVPGALLAVPIMATVIIVCAHIPALQPVAVLLSGSADRAKIVADAAPSVR